eukprot:RCo033658
MRGFGLALECPDDWVSVGSVERRSPLSPPSALKKSPRRSSAGSDREAAGTRVCFGEAIVMEAAPPVDQPLPSPDVASRSGMDSPRKRRLISGLLASARPGATLVPSQGTKGSRGAKPKHHGKSLFHRLFACL